MINAHEVVGRIDWDEHLETHRAYVAKNRHSKEFQLLSAECIAELGGFGYTAVERFLGRPPATWRRLNLPPQD